MLDLSSLLPLICPDCTTLPTIQLPQIAVALAAKSGAESGASVAGRCNGQILGVKLSPDCISPPETLEQRDFAAAAMPLLQLGSQGPAVQKLQHRLQQQGVYAGAMDGEFGADTEAAVAQWQQAHQLTVDGIVGPTTWTKLVEGSTPSPPAKPSPPASVTATINPPESHMEKRSETPSPIAVSAPGANAWGLNQTIHAWNGDSNPVQMGARSQMFLLGGGALLLISGGFIWLLRRSRDWMQSLSPTLLLAEGHPADAFGMITETANETAPGTNKGGTHSNSGANSGANSGGSASATFNGTANNGTANGTANRAANHITNGTANFEPSSWQGELSDLDEPIVLKQSPMWSKLILWSIIGVTSVVIVWANVAKIDESIPVQGKLEPQGEVKAVQAPVGGVVKTIHVKEGQRVKKGDLLVSFDATTAQAKLKSLQQIRQQLVQENNLYQSQTGAAPGSPSAATWVSARAPELIAPELIALTQNRAALLQENQLYRAELGGGLQGLSTEAQMRFQSRQRGRDARIAAAELNADQLTRQLSQIQVQLDNARDSFATNVEVGRNLAELVQEGAFARLPYLERQQTTNTSRAEVDRLIQEEARVRLAIAQAQEEVQNTIAMTQDDSYSRIAENEKRIADIDSQLTKIALENRKRIQEIDSQLSEVKLSLNYQDLRSPTDGTVFDLKPPSASYVANASEPVLKIVPDDRLVAKVSVNNQNIGFLSEGMVADVRIDSFPFSEFGEIQGELTWIGSDSMPPTPTQPQETFPAKIALKRQTLKVNDREVVLRSGMSLSANIKIRQRTVMSIFTEQFSKATESLSHTR